MAKVVLITGASDGIGFEIARQALEMGYLVYMLARDEERLRLAVESLPYPSRPRFASIDLTDEAQRHNFLIGLDEAEFVPDIVVNNAGMGFAGDFIDTPWERMESLVKLNMVAVAHITHWAVTRMKERGYGAVVNMSSAVATRPSPWFAAYAASKAFINSLSQALYVEAKPYGVHVAVVHPPEVRAQRKVSRQKADLSATLALRVLPSISAVAVAHAVLRAAEEKRRSVVPGFAAWCAMAAAGKVPAWLDLYIMSVLFKYRPWLDEKPVPVKVPDAA